MFKQFAATIGATVLLTTAASAACRVDGAEQAVLAEAKGPVSIEREQGLAAAVAGLKLGAGTSVTTGADAAAVLRFPNGCTVRLGANRTYDLAKGIETALLTRTVAVEGEEAGTGPAPLTPAQIALGVAAGAAVIGVGAVALSSSDNDRAVSGR